MAPARLATSVCFCGRIIRNDEAEEGSIYCSSKCARLDSMSALCAQESFEVSSGSRVKQVLRIGRKEALAKSSHYRRMERFGIGPSRSEQKTVPSLVGPTTYEPTPKTSPPSTNATQTKKTPGIIRLQPSSKNLRPLLLGSGKPPYQAQRQPLPTPSRSRELENRIRTAIASDEEDDDASDYGEEEDDDDDDDIPLAAQTRQKKETNLCSHFSDSSFGSSSLVTSGSDSTLSSMSSLTPSSSTGSLAGSLNEMSFSTVSLASSFRSEQARLVHNIPCIPLNAKSLKALSSSENHHTVQGKTAMDSEDMPTPKPVHGFLRLDMDFEESWRFDSSQSALSDLLKDF